MRRRRTYILLIGIFLILSACNPSPTLTAPAPLPSLDQDALYATSVSVVTISAFLTQQASSPTPAFSLPPTVPAPTPSPTALPEPPTPVPTPAAPCNLVVAGQPIDISIPDGSNLYPGQEFIKTWRVVNGGSCTWTSLYKYAFFSGNPMGAHQENRLTTEVQPGQALDVSVLFYAPTTPGEYQSAWMMQDENGQFFGMGLNADAPFFVKINVVEAPSTTQTP